MYTTLQNKWIIFIYSTRAAMPFPGLIQVGVGFKAQDCDDLLQEIVKDETLITTGSRSPQLLVL